MNSLDDILSAPFVHASCCTSSSEETMYTCLPFASSTILPMLMSAGSFENAAEILKKYVMKEMESHGRLVKNLSPQHEVGIRFYDFNTDKTYNLITIKFKLKLVQ